MDKIVLKDKSVRENLGRRNRFDELILKKFLDDPSAGPIPRQTVWVYPGIGRVIATELSSKYIANK